jgi:hypothetical protein
MLGWRVALLLMFDPRLPDRFLEILPRAAIGMDSRVWKWSGAHVSDLVRGCRGILFAFGCCLGLAYFWTSFAGSLDESWIEC